MSIVLHFILWDIILFGLFLYAKQTKENLNSEEYFFDFNSDIKTNNCIPGLDPARPLIDRFASKYFRLTKDDAQQVQIVHTNAGFLGEVNQVGHLDFCVNGGQLQPGCKGHRLSTVFLKV